jgi:hypothetical protein
MAPRLTVTLFVPGRLTNPMNGSHRHWSARAEWASKWRHRTRIAWLEAGKPTWDGPAVVTFTCYVARRFDSDAVPGLVKAVRDEAVELVLGTSDGPNCGHEFRYQQELRPDRRGVLVEIFPR